MPVQAVATRKHHAISTESNPFHLFCISNIRRNLHWNDFCPRITTFWDGMLRGYFPKWMANVSLWEKGCILALEPYECECFLIRKKKLILQLRFSEEAYSCKGCQNIHRGYSFIFRLSFSCLWRRTFTFITIFGKRLLSCQDRLKITCHTQPTSNASIHVYTVAFIAMTYFSISQPIWS